MLPLDSSLASCGATFAGSFAPFRGLGPLPQGPFQPALADHGEEHAAVAVDAQQQGGVPVPPRHDGDGERPQHDRRQDHAPRQTPPDPGAGGAVLTRSAQP